MRVVKTGTFQLPAYFKGIKEVEKQLDSTNSKIISAMSRYGPRNLLEISRRTGIPFTSVYHRVSRLEERSGRISYLIPQVSRLGLVRVLVLVTARAGAEDVVTKALQIPNLWRFVNRCDGAFTHLSAHTVPPRFLAGFRKYLREISHLDLATDLQIITTGDYIPNPRNFRYYDAKIKQWKFEWGRWLRSLRTGAVRKAVEDPEGYPILGDKKDIMIVKELEKNGRRTFADLAPILGITLQGVKYHYDKRLVPSGVVRYFDYDVWPYPVEISAYHEVMLEFTSTAAMNRFFTILEELFFVVGVAKVLRRNTLVARTYIPESQLTNMYDFFSELAKTEQLDSYSSVRLNFAGRLNQTLSYELFDEKNGWTVDLSHNLSQLRKLIRATAFT